jgi:hypothetical protein
MVVALQLCQLTVNNAIPMTNPIILIPFIALFLSRFRIDILILFKIMADPYLFAVYVSRIAPLS